MKKSLLLSAGMLLSAIAPAFGAEPETTEFSLYKYDNSFVYLGDYVGSTSYDEATNVYTMPDFLGIGVDFKFKLGEFNEADETYAIEVLSDITYDDYGDFTLDGAATSTGEFTNAYDGSKVKMVAFSISPSPYSSVYPPELPDYPDYSLQMCAYSSYDVTDSAGETTTESAEYLYILADLPTPADAAIGNVAVDNADKNAPTEYFNLQGMKITNPKAGNVYIRRQGSKTSKIAF